MSLLQAEGDRALGEAPLQRGRPARDGFGDVLEGGAFARASRAIVQTEGVLFAAPVQPDERGKAALLGFRSLDAVVMIG